METRLQIPRIWIPRPCGIPPSPPAERRISERREIERQVRSYRDRLPDLILPGYDEGRDRRVIVPGTKGYTEALRQVCMPVGVCVTGAGGPSSAFPANPPLTNLIRWYKANVGAYKDAGSTLCANGDTVQQWNDQGSDGSNESQGTSADRPTYNTNVVNGLPALTFTNAAGSFMTCTGHSTTPIDVFFVVNITADGSSIRGLFTQNVNSGLFTWKSGANDGIAVYNGAALNHLNAALNTWHIIEMQVPASGDVLLFVDNGSSFDTGVASFAFSGAFNIGVQGVDGGADMKLAELMVYSSIQGGANHSSVISYLDGKYGFSF